ncbi:MAG: VTT domain-containing protein, partial [Bacilli bacterium]|nr:VTT domain-containing protein [Bacilli bacterium]
FIDTTLQGMGIWGPIVGCFFITIESCVPILPLFVFITLNFLAFGHILGFVISWFFTCVGCSISFFLFRKKIQTWWYRRLKSKGLISIDTMEKITKLKFEQLVTIIAIPFTPAFLVNIAAGLSEMSYKKFLCALMLGKAFLVYFWGFVGVSLAESLKHPIYLVRVFIMVLVAYIVSKVIDKKLKIAD